MKERGKSGRRKRIKQKHPISKCAIFWNRTPYSPEVGGSFEGTDCIHLQKQRPSKANKQSWH
jgi:hypothetical protein